MSKTQTVFRRKNHFQRQQDEYIGGYSRRPQTPAELHQHGGMRGVLQSSLDAYCDANGFPREDAGKYCT